MKLSETIVINKLNDWQKNVIKINQKSAGIQNRVDMSACSEEIIHLLAPFKQFVHSITFDNSKEFCVHEKIVNLLSCNNYFATPYCSWECGQNENANGLLRQYFPKSMKLIDIAVKTVMIAADKLNSRPRKCLGYRTLYEAFLEATGVDARAFVILHL